MNIAIVPTPISAAIAIDCKTAAPRPPKVREVDPFKANDSFYVQPKADHIQLCDNLEKPARVLVYLAFRYRVDEAGNARLNTYRNGSYWWVESLKSLATNTRMTINQVRTAVKHLERLQLIEHKRKRYYGNIHIYYGKTVNHFRLGVAQGAAGLSDWPSITALSQMRIVLGCDFSQLSGCEKSQGMKHQAVETQESKNQTYKPSVTVSATASPTPTGTLEIPAGRATAAGKADGIKEVETPTAESLEETLPPENKEKANGVKELETSTTHQGFQGAADSDVPPQTYAHWWKLKRAGHDMAVLLKTCKKAGLVPEDRKWLIDDPRGHRNECQMLWNIELALHDEFPDLSLEQYLGWLAADYNCCADEDGENMTPWELMALVISAVYPAARRHSQPDSPSLTYLARYRLVHRDWTLKLERKAAQKAARVAARKARAAAKKAARTAKAAEAVQPPVEPVATHALPEPEQASPQPVDPAHDDYETNLRNWYGGVALQSDVQDHLDSINPALETMA